MAPDGRSLQNAMDPRMSSRNGHSSGAIISRRIGTALQTSKVNVELVIVRDWHIVNTSALMCSGGFNMKDERIRHCWCPIETIYSAVKRKESVLMMAARWWLRTYRDGESVEFKSIKSGIGYVCPAAQEGLGFLMYCVHRKMQKKKRIRAAKEAFSLKLVTGFERRKRENKITWSVVSYRRSKYSGDSHTKLAMACASARIKFQQKLPLSNWPIRLGNCCCCVREEENGPRLPRNTRNANLRRNTILAIDSRIF